MKGSYVPMVDPKRQWAGPAKNSPRHRVKNNLPGTPQFCPMVFRTNALEQFKRPDPAAGRFGRWSFCPGHVGYGPFQVRMISDLLTPSAP